MNISPIFNLPAFTDADGNPLAGGRIYTYEAGSFSVLKTTYNDQDGSVPNSNPIVLNSAGQLPVSIWLEPDQLYNLVLTAPDGVTVIKSFDDVTGVAIINASTVDTTSIWVETPNAVYLSGTQFLVPGNFAGQYLQGNRVRLTLSTGYAYGTVVSSVFSAPNTTVTIINDGAALNSSLSTAEYSILIANGRTIDAGAVSYTSALSYGTANTVGNKLKALDAEDVAIEARRARERKVYTTSGTGAFVISPSPAITSYTNEASWVVKFGATTNTGTLSVNGLEALPLMQFTDEGTLVPAIITDGLMSEVAYDSLVEVFIVLDPLPAPPPAIFIPPRGYQAFTSNGTFVVPENVYHIKVTCVGGGGSGGGGTFSNGMGGSDDSWNPGGGGGGGAVCFKYLDVTPGASYSVVIGAGGAAAPAFTNGNAGGVTSFGVTLVTAGGGVGGTRGNSVSSGTGGAGGSTGTGFLIPGGAGGNSLKVSNTGAGVAGGVGGISPGFGASGNLYGGGGVGALGSGSDFSPTSGTTSGAGRPGVVIVEW